MLEEIRSNEFIGALSSKNHPRNGVGRDSSKRVYRLKLCHLKNAELNNVS